MTTAQTQWGVFLDADCRNHVVPCDEDGWVAYGHNVDGEDCWCSPVRDPFNVIVHNHVDRRTRLH